MKSNLVFISSNYSGSEKDKNIENAKRYARMADIYNKVPIVPHLYFTTFLDDDYSPDRITGIYMGKQLMQYCSEMWIFCDELSDGMVEEIKEAKKIGLPMKFFTRERKELDGDNYLLHQEIGPAYRRLIAKSVGDCIDLGGDAGCDRCREDSGSKADSSKENDHSKDIKGNRCESNRGRRGIFRRS